MNIDEAKAVLNEAGYAVIKKEQVQQYVADDYLPPYLGQLEQREQDEALRITGERCKSIVGRIAGRETATAEVFGESDECGPPRKRMRATLTVIKPAQK